MASYDYDIGIIGGGAAGLTVAAGAAQLGARTFLAEKEAALGGDCLHYGCVPSKTLIQSARMYHSLGQTTRYGLPPVQTEPVDFKMVSSRIQEAIRHIQVHDSTERFCKLGVLVKFGAPRFLDEHSIDLEGQTVSAKSWVIATGSRCAQPRVKALGKIDYITNREIFSLEKLPDTLIVLGAGPIAVEMAQSFNRLGSKVFIIQRSGQILSKEDKDMADTVMNNLIEEGVTIHLNAAVTSASQDGILKKITFTDHTGKSVTLQADTVLLAQGRDPNIDGLGLNRIGIHCNDKGIAVDNRMRTNQKHIYAPGDVNGSFQFTHAAGYEAGIVLSNAVFHLPRKADYTWMPWCTYSDPELASIGLNEKSARSLGIEYQVWTENFSSNDRAIAEGHQQGKIKMLLDSKEKLIGVQIAGPRAGDLIGEWSVIANGNVKLSSLAGSVHPYPTLAEINKKVAGSFLSTKLFSDTVKKGLKLFFQLKGPLEQPCSQLESPRDNDVNLEKLPPNPDQTDRS